MASVSPSFWHVVRVRGQSQHRVLRCEDLVFRCWDERSCDSKEGREDSKVPDEVPVPHLHVKHDAILCCLNGNVQHGVRLAAISQDGYYRIHLDETEQK